MTVNIKLLFLNYTPVLHLFELLKIRFFFKQFLPFSIWGIYKFFFENRKLKFLICYAERKYLNLVVFRCHGRPEMMMLQKCLVFK